MRHDGEAHVMHDAGLCIISIDVTQVSCLNGLGTAIASHSITPVTGNMYGGRSSVTSGWMSHP